jgi:integrase
MALTDKWLRAHYNKPQEKRFEKAHREGLSVRVTLTGGLTFQYRYYLKDHKKYDRATLGSYPEMSLAAAAAELPRLKVMIAEGKNPKLELASTRIYEAKKLTLNELFEMWYHGSCKNRKVSHEEHYRSYEIHLKPVLGKLIADNIERGVFLSILNPLVIKSPSIAERQIVNLKQMYSWGRIQHIVDTDPLRDITAGNIGIEKGQDTRFFDHQEISWFWLAFNKTRIEEKNKIFLALAFHYGCRPGELRFTEKSHVNLDLGLWTVPWKNHKIGKKTKQPIVRPIINEVKHLWQRAMELSGSVKWLFTNRGTDEMIGLNSPAASMRNIETYWRKHIVIDDEHIRFDRFYLYTLRKTARTNFSSFGEWAVCEKMIGHKLPGETDKYDYNTYAEKMIPIYKAWYDLNQKIIIGEDNILPLLRKTGV